MRLMKKSAFKGVQTHLLAPRGERNNPNRILGVCLGILDRFVFFFEHEAESFVGEIKLDDEHEAKVEKHFGDFKKFPELEREIDRIIEEEPVPYEYGVRFTCSKTQDSAACIRFIEEFNRGYCEGWGLMLNDQGKWTWGTSRYLVLESLLAFWPDIELMRKSRAPKTRVELLECLRERAPDVDWGDQERFDKICDDIGLAMKAPGGPRGPRKPR